jgi:hypothetical protein
MRFIAIDLEKMVRYGNQTAVPFVLPHEGAPRFFRYTLSL